MMEGGTPLAPVWESAPIDRTSVRARTLIAVLSGLFGAPLSDNGIDRVLFSFEERRKRVSWQTNLALSLILFVHRFAPLLLGMSFFPLTSLSVEKRAHVLERLDHSRFVPFTLVFAGLKTMLAIDYLDGAPELSKIGYTGPSRKRHLRTDAS